MNAQEAIELLRENDTIIENSRGYEVYRCVGNPVSNEIADLIQSLQAENERLRTALEKLAKLGNGDRYGNSDGNVIAQDALKGGAVDILSDCYDSEIGGYCGRSQDVAKFIQSQQADNAELSKKIERLQAEVVRLTIENCRLIKISMYDGLGKPELIEEMCWGYAGDTDEPHIDCQCCKAFYGREEDE